jgi:hypothetical protein
MYVTNTNAIATSLNFRLKNATIKKIFADNFSTYRTVFRPLSSPYTEQLKSNFPNEILIHRTRPTNHTEIAGLFASSNHTRQLVKTEYKTLRPCRATRPDNTKHISHSSRSAATSFKFVAKMFSRLHQMISQPSGECLQCYSFSLKHKAKKLRSHWVCGLCPSSGSQDN